MKMRILKFASYFGLVVAITFVWLVYVEAVCFARLRASEPGTDLIPRERLRAVYAGANWVDAMAEEWAPSNRFAYRAYVGWERKPFAGRAINIDESGMRRSSPSNCDGNAYTIWMFGGSTVWGAGTPDWLTVPSQLGGLYEKEGRGVCVHNYGQKAWVSNQEVIKLILELKENQRNPDLVIFYDGPADVYETHQSGRAGLHQNFEVMARLFEGHAPAASGNFQYLLETNTSRFLLQQRQQTRMAKQVTAGDVAVIAQESVQNYMQNVRFVQALASQYGFKAAFFWQPTISTGNKNLTPEEQSARDSARQRTPGIEEANQAAYALMQAQCRTPMFCIADVFDQSAGTIYFDDAHVDAEGDRLIAKRMYELLHVPVNGS